ncbi:MAG: low molecular weight phosphotyrosine protein phosphatase [Anaerolineales bacterium]
MKICFVCQGNIIRSPLAENLFRRILQQRGVEEKYQLDSAGTSAYHVGEQPDRRMRQTARERGFQYDGRARQFQKDELDRFDLIIAMDQANRRILENWTSAESQLKKIRMMREFDPQGHGGLDVPDPYYGGPEGFERTYEIVERSVEGLVEALESGRITS